MAEIIVLDVVTKLDIPADRVIDAAKKAELQDVVVIGWDENGELYFASSKADGGDVLWLIEKAKKALIDA